MKKIAFLLMIVMAISLFAGCARSADTVTLNVLNWGDYIDEELITRFEDETGIKINYTTLANNEEMLVKLQQEDCIYDLCFPSDYIIEKLIGMDPRDMEAIYTRDKQGQHTQPKEHRSPLHGSRLRSRQQVQHSIHVGHRRHTLQHHHG